MSEKELQRVYEDYLPLSEDDISKLIDEEKCWSVLHGSVDINSKRVSLRKVIGLENEDCE